MCHSKKFIFNNCFKNNPGEGARGMLKDNRTCIKMSFIKHGAQFA